MKKLFILLLSIPMFLPQLLQAAEDWEPGYLTCDIHVRAPIARAWRAANYVENELAEIEREIEDTGECGDNTLELLEKLDLLIGSNWDPLRRAIRDIERCEKFFGEGLRKLLYERSERLEDRLFQASRKAADLQSKCK